MNLMKIDECVFFLLNLANFSAKKCRFVFVKCVLQVTWAIIGGKAIFRTRPYNTVSLISRYHGLDPDHSVVMGFQCIIKNKNDQQIYLVHF